METEFIYELIGYAASLLVAISLMMSAIVKLRIVNMIGAITFTIYGLLINSMPVAAMNAFIVVVNIYYLVKIYRDEAYFHLLETDRDSRYLSAFLDFYRDQIASAQPGFSPGKEHSYALFILSDMVPAGLILGDLTEDGTLEIDLDFVIPSYRDFKIGKFLFENRLDHFKKKGIQRISAAPGSEEHNRYLETVGFEKSGENYVLRTS